MLALNCSRLHWTDLLVAILVGGTAYWLYSLVWPLYPVGPDYFTYIRYYLDLWDSEPVYPLLMQRITPLPSLFFGGLMDKGSPLTAEVGLGILFAAGIGGVYAMGCAFSRLSGWLSVLVVIGHLPFNALLHTAGSDSLFATVLMIWGGMLCHTRTNASWRYHVTHGVMIFVLAMIRPVGQLWMLIALWPLFISSLSWWKRLTRLAIISGTASALFLLWSGYNWVRYNDFQFVRGSGGNGSFYRALVGNHLIHPTNGPYSKKLSEAVEMDLLSREPYAERNLTVETFFSNATAHQWGDMYCLSDRVWGWDSRYKVLREVGKEAVIAHPKEFAHGAGKDLWRVFSKPGMLPPRINKKKNLTLKVEGYQWGWSSSPTGRYASFEALNSLTTSPTFKLPARSGNREWTHLLHAALPYVPSTLIWLIAGCSLSLLTWRNSAWPALFLLVLAGLAATVVTVASIDADFRHRQVSDPIFIVFGVAGLTSLFTWIKKIFQTKLHKNATAA